MKGEYDKRQVAGEFRTDNSTMANGALPSTGIPFVIVNGTIVVQDSKVLKDVYPGQAIRMPVQNVD